MNVSSWRRNPFNEELKREMIWAWWNLLPIENWLAFEWNQMKLARRRRRRLRRCVTSRSEWVVSAQVESVTPVVSSASSAPDHPQGKVDGMVLIQRCCCISLRIGSYASAVYTMVSSVLLIIIICSKNPPSVEMMLSKLLNFEDVF